MQIALIVCASLAWQSAATDPAPKNAKKTRSDIDFWGTAATTPRSPKSKVQSPRSAGRTRPGTPERESDIGRLESVFAEPIRMPDGRFAIYVPPKLVLEFLEQPTKESARGYLAWQDERARKITDAMRILEEMQRDDARESQTQDPKTKLAESPSVVLSPKSPNHRKPEGSNPKPKMTLTYFRQPN